MAAKRVTAGGECGPMAGGEPDAALSGLAAALRHVAVAMAVIGPDGRVVAVNRAFGRLLGLEADAPRILNGISFADGGEVLADAAPWRSLAAGAADSFEREQLFLLGDGSVRRGHVVVSALRDDAGGFMGAVAHVRDAPARKAATEAGREHEARLSALVAQLPVALYRQEPGEFGAFHYVSPLFEQLTGLRQADLPTSFAELLERVHPDDRAAVQTADDRAACTGEPAHVQYRLRGGNGGWIWVDNGSVLMRDDDGRPLAWHGALLDVTARVRLEVSLRESETRFRRAFEDAAIGMSLGSPDYPNQLCLDANAAYCRIVGRRREELIGLPFEALTHPDDLAAYRQQMARLHAGEADAFEIEQRYPRPDGAIVIGRLTVSAVRDEAGAILYDFGQLQDITPYKAASAALREQQAHLRTVVEQIPAAVYRLEPGADGRFTFASPRFAALTGLALERRDGGLQAFFARVHPDDVAAVRAADASAGQTGQNFDLEYRLRGDDGSWIWVQDRSTLLRDEAGAPLAWYGIMLDISERKQLEASLRESEERFRSIFDGAAIGMMQIDPAGPIIDANHAMCRMLGYSRDQMRAMAFPDITHPDDLAPAVEAARRLVSGELDVHAFEKRFVRQDGRIVWGDLMLNAVRLTDGGTVCLIAQVQDVTARKAAEAALRANEARFRALVQNDPDVIAVIDADWQATYMSPSTAEAFGVPPEAMLGDVHARVQFIHPEDQERTLGLFDEVREQPGAAASAEARLRHEQRGWRWFQVTVANQLENPSIAGYILNVRDITERKEAALAMEAALETQRAAIDELEWLNQSKSRFLSTISHEFRTPLTAIIGYSEFLTANANDPQTVAEDASVIHREASRLNRMVDDVLLLDRADAARLPLQRETLHVQPLLRDVVAAFRPLTERHRIVLSVPPNLRPVAGDRDRLLQAVTNLVSNAVKYAPDGGEVAIAARNEGLDVLLSVQDQGIGIAAADLDRVFERFERVESGIAGRIAGAGLGLSIVREIAALHGGRVWAESEPGVGSTFYLSLPAVEG